MKIWKEYKKLGATKGKKIKRWEEEKVQTKQRKDGNFLTRELYNR